MSDIGIAVSLAAVLSVVIGLIEIRFRSKASFKALFGGAFLIYLLILTVGNVCTTLLSVTLVAAKTESDKSENSPSDAENQADGEDDTTESKSLELPGPIWFWYAFIGVFGFEALLKNVNVTLFGKGVLSIEEWISKARDSAEASAIESHTNLGFRRSQQLAEKLKTLSDADLKSHVVQILGQGELKKLEKTAQDTGADPKLIKTLALAHEKPDQAQAIIDAK